MKLLKTVLGKLGGISKAIVRFPMAFLALVTLTTINAVSIENNHDFSKQILSLVFAVFCFIVADILSEHFGKAILTKIIFNFIAAVISIGYYLFVLSLDNISMSLRVETIVTIFALFISFIWVPSINGRADFNDVFMSIFKAFFTSAFYSAIIWGGISLIIAAVDTLLVKVNENAYAHTANIIWVVWAPMLMLSLVPVFSDDEIEDEKIQKACSCPRFLEILLSYVLVPLVSIYTLVLLLYIVKTIFTKNWNDNLLEPMVLSYCIAVLLLYILLSNLINRFAITFRKIFPKILAPIALFQIVSSMIIVSSEGIIHSRYFVLMFGLYAVICGILLSIIPTRKNGIIAILAIAFALVCITPKIDAFSTSYASQSSIIQNILKKNNMLNDNNITPNANVSEDDKINLTRAVLYFESVNELKRLEFLPKNFEAYKDFKSIFGFDTINVYTQNEQTSKSFTLDSSQLIEIGSYDYLSNINLQMPEQIIDQVCGSLNKNGNNYKLLLNVKDDNGTISIKDAGGNEIISVPLETIFDRINDIETVSMKGQVSAEKLTFDFENSAAKIRIVFRDVSIYNSGSEMNRYANAFVLVSIK